MTRRILAERVLMQVYGGLPDDDAEMTVELVNAYLPDAIGSAVKQAYTDAIKLDGIGYVNNSFYSTFTGLQIAKDTSENFLYALELPHVPYGLGKNEGVASIRFTKNGKVSLSGIFLSVNQWTYADTMRPVQNKILCCPEGNKIKVKTTLPLWDYTANVVMVSAGLPNDLDAVINVPDDYLPAIVAYIRENLLIEKSQVREAANDGTEQT